MDFDISRQLDQWAYQPGKVAVRKFVGKDGGEKIQLRVDLGILQMNAEGRPDGKRPLGHESWLDYYQFQWKRHTESHHGSEESFALNSEDCARLQQEAIQYYH